MMSPVPAWPIFYPSPDQRGECGPSSPWVNEAVKVYAKHPSWSVPTPLGPYNPGWAVFVEKDGAERLYLVVETKSSLFTDDLREKESAKIACGKAHFKALAGG